MHDRRRSIMITLMVAGFTAMVALGFPIARGLLRGVDIEYYTYSPGHPVQAADTASLPPAKSVPILMYHGVTLKADESNTTLENFRAQLEMLKANGYQTIRLEELEAFYRGQGTLPPRPIILTFDDGRKDSYLTTDDILRKLDFRAVMFVATGKVIAQDSFYLTWDELRQLRDSGRWDLHAHGRHSHDEIFIDDQGTRGHYLSSREFRPGTGLETVEEFERRVEQDYTDGIRDLRENLGIDSPYYAIPLSDYGTKPISNYADALTFNDKMIRKYFRMSFVQGLVYDKADEQAYLAASRDYRVYNFRDQDPYATVRLEPKNMSADTLRRVLEAYVPAPPYLLLSASHPQPWLNETRVLYGDRRVRADGLRVLTKPGTTSAKIVVGHEQWSSYRVTARVRRDNGRSTVLLGHVLDNYNHVSFGFTDGSVFLREMVENRERQLQRPFTLEIKDGEWYTLVLEFMGNRVTAKIDDRIVYRNIPTSFQRGAVGIKAWGPDGASTTVEKMHIEPLNE